MKRKAVMCLAAVFCLGSSMTAYAAPEVMPDGTVFDAEYYAENNPDVVAALGTDVNILYQHYINYGKAEGRLGSANINTNINANKSLNGIPYIERTAEDVALIGGSNDVVRKDYSDSELYQGLWNQAMQNINAYITGTKIWLDDPANSEDYYGYLINYKFSNKDWKYKEWFEIWNTVANFELDLKKYILSNYGEITVICRDGTVETLKIDYNRKQVRIFDAITAETGIAWINFPLNGDYVVQMLLSK